MYYVRRGTYHFTSSLCFPMENQHFGSAEGLGMSYVRRETYHFASSRKENLCFPVENHHYGLLQGGTPGGPLPSGGEVPPLPTSRPKLLVLLRFPGQPVF